MAKPVSKDALKILARVNMHNAWDVMVSAVDNAMETTSPSALGGLEEAVCACREEPLRERMGTALRESLNVLRLATTPARGEVIRREAHLIVTVPFLLHGTGKISSIKALQTLSGAIDERMDTFRDPHGANLPGLVLAVPGRHCTPTDLIAVNFMLGNPERKEADATYFDWWKSADAPTLAQHQDAVEPVWFNRQAFFYAFAMAVPGLAPRQALDDSLKLTDYGQSVVEVIMECAAKTNRSQADLQIELLEVQKLSDGVDAVERFAIRQTLRNLEMGVRQSGPDNRVPAATATVLAGIEIVQRPRASQLVGLGLFSEADEMLACARLILPVGFPRSRIEDEVNRFASQLGASAAYLPVAFVEQHERNALGVAFMRGPDGSWADPSLLKLGPRAKEILRTGEWSAGWDVRLLQGRDGAFMEELLRLPDPIRQKQGGMDAALNEHYTPEFLRRFKEVIKRPGIDLVDALVDLQEAHGYPIEVLMQAGHAKQLAPPAQMYAALHFAAARGALFVVRRRLQDALAETDIADDYPTESLRAPFADCYFHFEEPATVTLPDGATLRTEGFYVSESVLPEDEGTPETRVVKILPVTTEVGDVMSLTSEAFQFYCTPGDGRTLHDSFVRLDAYVTEHRLPAGATVVGEFIKTFLKTLVKVLLYTTLPDQRRREVAATTDPMPAKKGKGGTTRKNPVGADGHRFDFISIGPENDQEDDAGITSASDDSGVRKSFVRRGSYVSQPCGPGHSRRETRWRRPTIVNRDASGSDPDKPTYVID